MSRIWRFRTFALFESHNIFDCCAFLCYWQAVLCCNSFAFPRPTRKGHPHKVGGRPFATNRKARFYSLFVGGLFTAIVFTAVYAICSSPQQKARLLSQNKLVLLIAVLELCTSLVAFLTTVLTMQHLAGRHVAVYAAIHRLDERLRCEFAVNLNFYKLRRKNIIIISLVAAAYVAAVCLTIARLAFDEHNNNARQVLMVFAGVSYAFMTGGPHFTGYVHMNLTEILKIRFRVLQRILQREFLLRHFPKESLRMAGIESAVEMVKEFHGLIADINRVYQWSLLTSQLHDFTLTTSQLYLIADSLIKTNKDMRVFTYMIVCMLAPLYKMIMAPVYADLCLQEGRRCLQIIEHLDVWFPQQARLRSLVHGMMLWRRRNDQHFSTRLMRLDIPTTTMITSAIFNYIFILIQFSMTEEMGATMEQQKNVLKEWIEDIEI